MYAAWISSCPAGKPQGVRSDPRRTKLSSKLCSTFQTRGLDHHLKIPSGVRAVRTCPKNQSLQQTITEHEDCPRDPALRQDQEIKLPWEDRARLDSELVPAGGRRWAGGCVWRPRAEEPETGLERRKPGQVPVAALGSKGNCFSSWGRAGQGSPAGQQVCDQQASSLGWTPSVSQSPSEPCP